MNRRLFLLSTSAMAVTTALGVALPEMAVAMPAPVATGKVGYGYLALSDAMMGEVMADEVLEIHLTTMEYDNVRDALAFTYDVASADLRAIMQNILVFSYLDRHGKIVLHPNRAKWPVDAPTWEDRPLV